MIEFNLMAIPEVSFESTQTVEQQEFARWAESRARWDLNHYELLNGRIVMTPPAGYPHGSVGTRVVRLLAAFAIDRGLGEVLDASQGFELPSGDTVEPDASFVSTERWAAMGAPEAGTFLRVVPDLVVEILSPSSALRDRGEKKAIYERNGVREYWLVDPRPRQVTVFLLDADGRFDDGAVYAGAEIHRCLTLPALELRPRDLFP